MQKIRKPKFAGELISKLNKNKEKKNKIKSVLKKSI